MKPTIHATAIAVNEAGVLLLGPPGAGKSDLALRLIDRGARLIADDRVIAEISGAELLLSAPDVLAGLLEVRGIGLLQFPAVANVPARLAVRLGDVPARLPEPEVHLLEGHVLPLLRLSPFEASAPLKIELAVAHGLPIG